MPGILPVRSNSGRKWYQNRKNGILEVRVEGLQIIPFNESL